MKKPKLREYESASKVLVVMRYRKIFGGHEKFEISETFESQSLLDRRLSNDAKT